MMSARLRRDDMESAMAWLSLLLFLPWFLLLGSLYWLFPRQPRTRGGACSMAPPCCWPSP